VAGQTPKSIAAIANLKKICDQHLPGRYEVRNFYKVERWTKDGTKVKPAVYRQYLDTARDIFAKAAPATDQADHPAASASVDQCPEK
jgi:hypothetical protein